MLPNVDDGPTKELLIASGWADRPLPREELHDLLFDPAEAANVADDPAYSEVRAELAERLEAWMRETDDPLLDGRRGAAARRGSHRSGPGLAGRRARGAPLIAGRNPAAC